ncbi:MAG TPA: hypothetical protein PLN91_00765 [Rhodanobacteraceae bacterium]|nr:hypothetical protein [Rhodanobacteraceae bacterium]
MTCISLPKDFFQGARKDAKNLILALPIIVRAMTQKQGIKVRIQQGVGVAWTTPDTLAIEAFPLPKANSMPGDFERMLALYMGGLDHEIGHHRHSRLTWLTKQLEGETDLLHGLVNAIEDPRMEAALAKEYPGCDRNMRALSHVLVSERRDTAVTTQVAPAKAVTHWAMHWLRAHLRKESIYLPLAQEGEPAIRQMFGDAMTEKLLSLLNGALGMASVEDALQVAREIQSIIQAAATSTPQSTPSATTGMGEDSDDDSTSEASAQSAAAEKDDSESANDPDTTDDDAEEADSGPSGTTVNQDGTEDADSSDQGTSPAAGAKDDSESANDPDTTDDDAEEADSGPSGTTANQDGTEDADSSDQATSPAAGAKDDARLSEGEEDSSASAQTGGPASNSGKAGAKRPAQAPTPAQIQAAQDALNGDAAEMVRDRGQVVSDAIQEEFTDLSGKGLIEDHRSTLQGLDPGVPQPIADGYLDTISLSQVTAVSARVRQRLIAKVQSQSRQRTLLRTRGYTLDTTVLHRIATGDGRIFLTEREDKGINTALFLLLDASGSMAYDDRIKIAREALLATALAADMVPGLATGVGAFPGDFIIKPFGQSARSTYRKFAVDAYGDDTPLDEGVLMAAQLLAARDEPRRMLVVATDGMPSSEWKARDALRVTTGMGIEVYGLGIGTQISRTLIPQSKTLANIQALPDALFSLLSNVALAMAA